MMKPETKVNLLCILFAVIVMIGGIALLILSFLLPGFELLIFGVPIFGYAGTIYSYTLLVPGLALLILGIMCIIVPFWMGRKGTS